LPIKVTLLLAGVSFREKVQIKEKGTHTPLIIHSFISKKPLPPFHTTPYPCFLLLKKMRLPKIMHHSLFLSLALLAMRTGATAAAEEPVRASSTSHRLFVTIQFLVLLL
jgi:hypothetical protein